MRGIAAELVRADGSVLPALVDSAVRGGEPGRPRAIRTTVFDATDRRRYEQELLRATRREREIAQQLQRSLLSGALPQAPGHWEGRSPPLDATLGLVERSEVVVSLGRGATLVLYADGLVEHPQRPIEEGTSRLASELAADAGGPLDAFTQAAFRSLDEQLDDVCVAAVRLA